MGASDAVRICRKCVARGVVCVAPYYARGHNDRAGLTRVATMRRCAFSVAPRIRQIGVHQKITIDLRHN